MNAQDTNASPKTPAGRTGPPGAAGQWWKASVLLTGLGVTVLAWMTLPRNEPAPVNGTLSSKISMSALQSATTEGDHLRHYEAKLAQGHLVVDVTVHGRRKRDTVVQILRSHGAHFINAYGPWAIESVAA